MREKRLPFASDLRVSHPKGVYDPPSPSSQIKGFEHAKIRFPVAGHKQDGSGKVSGLFECFIPEPAVPPVYFLLIESFCDRTGVAAPLYPRCENPERTASKKRASCGSRSGPHGILPSPANTCRISTLPVYDLLHRPGRGQHHRGRPITRRTWSHPRYR